MVYETKDSWRHAGNAVVGVCDPIVLTLGHEAKHILAEVSVTIAWLAISVDRRDLDTRSSKGSGSDRCHSTTKRVTGQHKAVACCGECRLHSCNGRWTKAVVVILEARVDLTRAAVSASSYSNHSARLNSIRSVSHIPVRAVAGKTRSATKSSGVEVPLNARTICLPLSHWNRVARAPVLPPEKY